MEAHVCSGADVGAVKVSASPAQSRGRGGGWEDGDRAGDRAGDRTRPRDPLEWKQYLIKMEKTRERFSTLDSSGVSSRINTRARARNTGGVTTYLNINVFHFTQ